MADEPRFLCNIAKSEFGVLAFTATESISAPYEVQLTLVTEREVNFDDVIGKAALLTLKPDDTSHGKDTKRYFHGIINEFMKTKSKGRFLYYQATMVPSLWLLSLERDCRIFQNKTVPDIVGTILNEAGIKEKENFSFRVKKGDYEPREYCVQYRETDLDFISRLLEEEGIFYFFEHTDQKHLLVFGDSTVNYKPIPGEPKVVFNPTGGMVVREEAVHQFAFSRQIRSGKYTLRDFNFEKPTLDLTAQDKATSHQELEVYDYPGEYLEQAPGKRLAKIRLEEAVMFKDLATGNSSCPRFTPCFTYQMTKHEHSQFNKEYLLIRMVHNGTQPQVLEELADSDSTFSYANEFSAIPSSVTFRPGRDTPKPIVEGVQTAIVVGPKGEEIYTDEHGRVKVQFHWDREGKKDEKSSCWMRVSQVSAGAGWGAIDIPRIGHEVIVDFLEGDPDKPIITGRVYHGTNRTPTGLPQARMVSGMKSNTTPGGGGYNQMTMDDTKGKENITVHAQYDMNTTVEHDQTNTVNNKFTETIKSDATIQITEGNYSHDVVTGTAKYHVMADLTEDYDATQTTTVAREIRITSESASISITAATEISLTVGASSLLMKSDGSIKLSGVDVAINGSGSVNIHGMSVTSSADADHNTKGAIVVSEGSATNTVKGGMVMLNP